MKDLFRNIYKCEQVYKNNSDSLVQELMLKLALLEVGGWIENAFDELYRKTGITTDAKKEIDTHINKVYKFSYDQLKKTLSFCIGINKFMDMEINCPNTDLTLFKSSLKTIKDLRDELAHNHLHVTHNYIAFNALKIHIKTIYAGIKYIKNSI